MKIAKIILSVVLAVCCGKCVLAESVIPAKNRRAIIIDTTYPKTDEDKQLRKDGIEKLAETLRGSMGSVDTYYFAENKPTKDQFNKIFKEDDKWKNVEELHIYLTAVAFTVEGKKSTWLAPYGVDLGEIKASTDKRIVNYDENIINMLPKLGCKRVFLVTNFISYQSLTRSGNIPIVNNSMNCLPVDLHDVNQMDVAAISSKQSASKNNTDTEKFGYWAISSRDEGTSKYVVYDYYNRLCNAVKGYADINGNNNEIVEAHELEEYVFEGKSEHCTDHNTGDYPLFKSNVTLHIDPSVYETLAGIMNDKDLREHARLKCPQKENSSSKQSSSEAEVTTPKRTSTPARRGWFW